MKIWRMFFCSFGALNERQILNVTLGLGLFFIIELSASLSAYANPFFVGRFNGLLGGPLDQSAFSLYWNPANLYSDQFGVDVHLGFISRQATYTRVLPDDVTEEVKQANGGESTTSALGALPSFAFHSGIKFNPDLRLGLGGGIYIARAGTADWDRDPEAPSQYPGAYDGPQRWSALSTFMLLVNYAAGASLEYKALSVGMALSYVESRLSTTKAANADKSDDLSNPDGAIKEGRIFLDNASNADYTMGEKLNATFGASLDLDKVELGYSWRLPKVHQLSGTAYVLYSNAPETTAKAQVQLQVAESHLVSVAYTLNAVRFRFEYERQLWSIMDNQKIVNLDQLDPNGNPRELLLLERDFQDTNAYRLRLDYKASDALSLHTGLSYEDGVSTEEYHEPGLAEHDQIELGFGASFPLTKQLSLHSTFFYQYFFDRTVTKSKQSPTTNGDYTDHRQYLTLNLRWSL